VRSTLLAERDGLKTFVLVFDKNDDVQALLLEFDRGTKDYRQIPVAEQVEVLAFLGNIARAGDQPKVHAHVVVGKADGTAHGGHLLSGRVWPTLEMIITETPAHLRRVHDPDTGLALIDLTR
jgi:uncharacterized protein